MFLVNSCASFSLRAYFLSFRSYLPSSLTGLLFYRPNAFTFVLLRQLLYSLLTKVISRGYQPVPSLAVVFLSHCSTL